MERLCSFGKKKESFMFEAQAFEQALIKGDWEQVFDLATQWSQSQSSGPPAFFSLNVIYLLRGEFALAWKMHAKSLHEEEDIKQVQEWVGSVLEAYPNEGYVHLIHGLFLAQSGQSEQSLASYQECARLVPESPFPHFFMAQIYQWMKKTDQVIKAYREAVKLDPNYIAARLNLGEA